MMDEIKKLAQVYLDAGLTEIFGTEDRQFFYKEFDAKKYCSREKKQYWRFSTEDKVEDVEQPKKLSKKQKLQAECDNLGIEYDQKATSSDLETLIELKKEE